MNNLERKSQHVADIGNRINKEILQNKRAHYGKQIVSRLSAQLKSRYGRNFE